MSSCNVKKCPLYPRRHNPDEPGCVRNSKVSPTKFVRPEPFVQKTMPYTASSLSAAEGWLHDNCPDVAPQDFDDLAESLATAFTLFAQVRS